MSRPVRAPVRSGHLFGAGFTWHERLGKTIIAGNVESMRTGLRVRIRIVGQKSDAIGRDIYS